MPDLSRLRAELAASPLGQCAWCGAEGKRRYCSQLCAEALTCYFLSGPMAAPVDWKWLQFEPIDLGHRWISEQGRVWGRCFHCGSYFHAAEMAMWCKRRCASISNTQALNRMRRAVIAASPEVEPLKLEAIAARDEWICHLCRGRVDRWTWSMDHLVPLSKGGKHTYANVLLAHRSCNSRRGTKPLDQFR